MLVSLIFMIEVVKIIKIVNIVNVIKIAKIIKSYQMFEGHVGSWMKNGFMNCSEQIKAKYEQVVNNRELM